MADAPNPPPPPPPPPSPEPAPAVPQPADAAKAAESALEAAQAAVADLKQAVPPGEPEPFAPGAFEKSPPSQAAKGLDLLSDVNLNVKIELGRTRMLVEDVLRLGEGAVVELDKLAGDPVDVYVNERHIARGEVLVLNDNFCVRINEIVAGAGEHEAQRIRAGKA